MNVVYGRYTGTPSHPDLCQVMAGVFVKAPLMKFVAAGASVSDDWIIKFDVYIDVEKVGALSIYLGRNGKRCIRIESPNIRKERGANRQAKDTTNVKVAVKTCLEVMKPKDRSKIADDILTHFGYALNRVLVGLRNSVTSPFIANYHAATVMAARFFSGYKPGDPLPADIVSFVESSKLAEHTATFDALASLKRDYVDTKFGAVLSTAPEDSFIMVHLNAPDNYTVVKDTYDLPVNYQEKLAILKIMGPNEPIENVGVKYLSDTSNPKSVCYFLAGGDTIASS